MVRCDISHAVIADTCHSKSAILKPFSIRDVHLDDGFWKTRYRINVAETLPSQYAMLESTGRIDNFIHAAGGTGEPISGYVFNDSDVYKWLEAASLSLINPEASQIQPLVDMVISLIASAQQQDGYLNTYFSGNRSGDKWTNLQVNHELYCAGHMIQAAVAHHRVTGDITLLNVAYRLADHLYDIFGPSKREGTGGHPEIEMALIELYRESRNLKYLNLAKLFIDRRGYGLLGGSEYLLDHQPFRCLELLAGHAVRALYLCAGAADLFMETGEIELLETLERLWDRMVNQQAYITGGVGSRHEGESFGAPFELPNATAYAETCAAIASVMWNWRMLQITGEARYCDALEWTLFNAVLPGVSLDGRKYFYVNPLLSWGNHERKPWFDCACCPPNVSRTIAMLPGYIYSQSPSGLWINLFASSSISIQLIVGKKYSLRQTTSYPWEGRITIEISETQGSRIESPGVIPSNPFSLFIRMPGWITENRASIKINQKNFVVVLQPGSYLEIHRNWQNGDTVEIDFPMEVQFNEAHPLVLDNNNRAAITRGPLVYCLEAEDNPGINLYEVVVNPSVQPTEKFGQGLFDGFIQLEMDAEVWPTGSRWKDVLYQPISAAHSQPSSVLTKVTAVPYFCWANRSPGAMQIWNRYK